MLPEGGRAGSKLFRRAVLTEKAQTQGDPPDAPPAAGERAKRGALRVAVVLDASMQPAWIHRALSDLSASAFADVVLVIDPRRSPPAASVQERRPYSAALYSLYRSIDRRLFGSLTPAGPRIRPPGDVPVADPFAHTDVGPLLGGVERVTAGVTDGSAALRLSEADVDALLPYRLDVVLSFAPVPPVAPLRAVSGWGIWSYHYGDDRYEGFPPGFWEVMDASPVTSLSLRTSIEDAHQPIRLYGACTSTDRFSVTRNLDNVLWTSSSFPLRLLRAIHEGRSSSPEEFLRTEVPLPFSERRRTVPTNGQMCGALSRHAARLVEDRLRHKFVPERWALAYHQGPGTVPLHSFTPLIPPEPAQWADPFPVLFEGSHHLFFEEQTSPSEPGRISVMTMTGDGKWTEPVAVVKADYHLSYPHVFPWDENFFMIPETQAARRVELYRCREFPYVWELDRVLLEDFRGVDPTITEFGGRWWMFLNSAEEGARNCEELHLFSAPTPTGPWQPHPGNPVSSDARTSRPAGRIFEWHGRLMRPSQDCGGQYGRAVVLNEVIRLDEQGFEERPVARIDPNWDPHVARVHTFNTVPGLTFVDCLRREPLLRRRV